MKISRIQLSNVRGFKSLELHNLDDHCLLFTGNNGNGKTTLLRALSLAFCDEMGASGLLSELPGQFITFDQGKALVSVELQDEFNEKIKIDTEIIEKFGTEQVRKYYSIWENGNWVTKTEGQLASLSELPHTGLFSVGYGTCLRILGKERYNNYYSADASYSLFKIDTFLQEQELVFRRLLDQAQNKSANKEKVVKKAIKDLLVRVLNYPEGSHIRLEGNGIFFGRSKKYPSELTTKGDGVRAVATMVLDLMSWWYLYLIDNKLLNDSNYYDSTKVKGIVFIDEVALYLHPSWQKNIVGDLISAFPNVQFVISTHAPLAVSGATDFENEVKFFRLSKKDNFSSAHEYELTRGSTADDVLTSEAFGLSTTVSPKMESTLLELEKKLDFKQKEGDSTKVSDPFNWVRYTFDNNKGDIDLDSEPVPLKSEKLTQESFLNFLSEEHSFEISDETSPEGMILVTKDNHEYQIPDPRELPWNVWVNMRSELSKKLIYSLNKNTSLKD